MNPRFVYTGGPYRQFRGYEFVNGKAVTITDRATVEALKRSHDFKEIVDAPQETQATPQVLTNSCPKCGKPLKVQGAHFHIRACKG